MLGQMDLSFKLSCKMVNSQWWQKIGVGMGRLKSLNASHGLEMHQGTWSVPMKVMKLRVVGMWLQTQWVCYRTQARKATLQHGMGTKRWEWWQIISQVLMMKL